jgi:hypothetical protein
LKGLNVAIEAKKEGNKLIAAMTNGSPRRPHPRKVIKKRETFHEKGTPSKCAFLIILIFKKAPSMKIPDAEASWISGRTSK